jgi:hypothetical protein
LAESEDLCKILLPECELDFRPRNPNKISPFPQLGQIDGIASKLKLRIARRLVIPIKHWFSISATEAQTCALNPRDELKDIFEHGEEGDCPVGEKLSHSYMDGMVTATKAKEDACANGCKGAWKADARANCVKDGYNQR